MYLSPLRSARSSGPKRGRSLEPGSPVALAPPHLAAHDAGQVALLLLRAAEEAMITGATMLDDVPAWAAELLMGQAQPLPALLAQDLGPARIYRPSSGEGRLYLADVAGRFSCPGARSLAERLFFRREIPGPLRVSPARQRGPSAGQHEFTIVRKPLSLPQQSLPVNPRATAPPSPRWRGLLLSGRRSTTAIVISCCRCSVPWAGASPDDGAPSRSAWRSGAPATYAAGAASTMAAAASVTLGAALGRGTRLGGSGLRPSMARRWR